MSDPLDYLKSEVNILRSENLRLKFGYNIIKNSNVNLASQILKVSVELQELQQYLRVNNIQISGLHIITR